MERLGYADRDAQRCSAAASRSASKREARRTRIDLLVEGVTDHRDRVPRRARAIPAPPLNADRPRARRAAPRRRGRARRVPRSARGVPDQREGRGAPHAPAAVAAIGKTGLSARYAVRSVAGVAQTVEQLTRNEQARSSSLLSGSRGFPRATPHRRSGACGGVGRRRRLARARPRFRLEVERVTAENDRRCPGREHHGRALPPRPRRRHRPPRRSRSRPRSTGRSRSPRPSPARSRRSRSSRPARASCSRRT